MRNTRLALVCDAVRLNYVYLENKQLKPVTILLRKLKGGNIKVNAKTANLKAR